MNTKRECSESNYPQFEMKKKKTGVATIGILKPNKKIRKANVC